MTCDPSYCPARVYPDEGPSSKQSPDINSGLAALSDFDLQPPQTSQENEIKRVRQTLTPLATTRPLLPPPEEAKNDKLLTGNR